MIATTSSKIGLLSDFAACVSAVRTLLVTCRSGAIGILPSVDAGLSSDGGCYALKHGEAPAQSMCSRNLGHVEAFCEDVLEMSDVFFFGSSRNGAHQPSR